MKKLFIALALVALLLSWGHSGAQQAEANGVDLSIEGVGLGCDTSGGPTTCNVPVSTQFTVTMNVDVLPPSTSDYDAFQGYLAHTAGLTRNDRTGQTEIVWPDCEAAGEMSGVGWYLGGCAVVYGGPSTWTGAVMEVDYTCGASPSQETVTMEHGSTQYKTYLVDSLAQKAVDPDPDETLTIECQALEACCFPDESCQNLIPSDCTTQGGTPKGPGTVCLGVEACAFPDGSCADIDALCCLNQGGDPGGSGSVCLGVEACCYPDDSCGDHDAHSCLVAGGTPQGAGTNCAEVICEAAAPGGAVGGIVEPRVEGADSAALAADTAGSSAPPYAALAGAAAAAALALTAGAWYARRRLS